MLLCIGGHYTYARVPLFTWLEPSFRLAAEPIRSTRTFRPGICPGVDRARALHPTAGRHIKRLAIFHHRPDLHGDQRRSTNCSSGPPRLIGGVGFRCLSRHAGRRLGYPKRHVHGLNRRRLRSALHESLAEQANAKVANPIVRTKNFNHGFSDARMVRDTPGSVSSDP